MQVSGAQGDLEHLVKYFTAPNLAFIRTWSALGATADG
jgi:hypothetical protein